MANLPFKGIPTRAQLSNYVVNREGWEGITQSLYDFQAYPAAGVSTLNFFAIPNGSGKTTSDTNMTLAGQLPVNQEFLVSSIEVFFFPTTPTVAGARPSDFGAQLAAEQANDEYIFRRSGNLNFVIGSKSYLTEAPMQRFPQKTCFTVEGAFSDTTTAGVDQQLRLAWGKTMGRPYQINPVLLTSNQNFSVQLSWPEGPQAIANAARVGVVLDGILFRRSQ